MSKKSSALIQTQEDAERFKQLLRDLGITHSGQLRAFATKPNGSQYSRDKSSAYWMDPRRAGEPWIEAVFSGIERMLEGDEKTRDRAIKALDNYSPDKNEMARYIQHLRVTANKFTLTIATQVLEDDVLQALALQAVIAMEAGRVKPEFDKEKVKVLAKKVEPGKPSVIATSLNPKFISRRLELLKK